MQFLSPLIGLLLLLAACTGSSAQGRADYGEAMKYLQGVGVEQNQAKAMALLKKASDERNPDAELVLGYFLLKGENGQPQNQTGGIKLFIDAAGQGNRDAQYNVGLAYVRSQGVKEDYKQALKWFTAAAMQGDPGAQYNLGVMYLNGEGTVKNALTAFAWFSIAEANEYDGAKQGKDAARQAMTSDEAKEAPATIEKLKSKIVKPTEPTTVDLTPQSLPNQPL